MEYKKIISLDDEILMLDKDSICIVLYCNDCYFMYTAVTVLSIIENASEDKLYDLIVLVDEIGDSEQCKMGRLVAEYKNVSVRIFSIHDILDVFNGCKSKNYHISIWFRLLVMTNIFKQYGKLITMDSDMVCNCDIEQLYSMNIESYCLAASYEIDARWRVRSKYPVDFHFGTFGSEEYYYKYLGIKDVKKYFCSGVLLWNLELVRQDNAFENIILDMKKKPYLFPDQDLLNLYYEEKTKDIGRGWNYTNYLLDHYQAYLSNEEREIFEKQNNIYILHYAGKKPWNYINVNYGELFWRYAIKVPWYEDICKAQQNNIQIRKKRERKKNGINILFPEGTIRKDIVRYILTAFYKLKNRGVYKW